ncbi:MAG: hypothetical protein SPL13_05530, partial [Clostridia bacterium]|nr:hypothetical protein [Clostridia bacterium]
MEEDIKKNYRNLKERYSQLKTQYSEEKHSIIDKSRSDFEILKNEYKINRLSIKKPLKAQKYRLKIQNKAKNRKLNEPPKRRLIEEIGNSITHGVGALIALICLILMIVKSRNGVAL